MAAAPTPTPNPGKALGCHLGQGYYFANPMTPDRVVAYLRPSEALPIDERTSLFD